MAKPYKEGKTWSFRVRCHGERIYRSGFATEALARKALLELTATVRYDGKPLHQGPWRTTLAQALRDYAIERLPFLKGASQEASRINRYLRHAGLPTLRVKQTARDAMPTRGEAVLWTVESVPTRAPRKIPRSLYAHRQALADKKALSDGQRKTLALLPVANVHPHDIQRLIDAMTQDGYRAASVGLERALLRQLFAHAKRNWSWPEPRSNPAQGLKMPKVDNARDRVLSNKEWSAISHALMTCSNRYVAPTLAMLLETAMRSSETLVTARWVDWDRARDILRLTDAKAGPRDVPLSPRAIAVLKQVEKIAQEEGGRPVEPGARIFPISYEALKAAWYRACQRAGIEGIRLHDLRHTSATRFALEYNGNLPVLKIITGHKTHSQLMRYINIKSHDVARLMHGRALDHDDAPAGLELKPAAVPEQTRSSTVELSAQELPHNVIPLRRAARVA